jgi:hypothetical protein
MSDKPYFYVGFSSGGLERVGDWEFERKLERLAKQCRGDFSGAGYGGGVRDYGFIFKSEESAERFNAELGRRAKAWKISGRYIDHVDPREE